MESGSEGEDDDEQIFRPRKKNNVRNGAKRRKPSPEDDGDFEQSREADEYSDDGELGHTLVVASADRRRHGRFRGCR